MAQAQLPTGYTIDQQAPAGLPEGYTVDAPATAPEPTMLQKAMTGAKDLGIGALKGAGSTMSMADDWARQHLPAAMTNTGMGFGKPEDIPAIHAMMQPQGTAQSIGKGVEQAAEFMIPGGAEEKLLGKAPLLARMAGSAVGAGAVNKAQGGSFGAGAAMGAGGQALGSAMKAVAPSIAEGALGIPKAARAFGKTPGRAILDETSGIRPETVASSARGAMNRLTPELEAAADKASVKPNPVRGMLQAPPEEIPLPVTGARAPKSTPTAFDAQVNPEEPMEPRSGNPMAPISEYPGINPHYLSGSEHPEMSGRVGTPQGTLIRPFQAPEGAPPFSPWAPNTTASLGPARTVLGNAANTAKSQNAEGLYNQLGNMRQFLGTRFAGNEPIPENVTPRDLLNLKRGFSEEHLRWNPEIHDKALSAGRQAYGALDQELDRTVPEAAGLNQRISSLIPVAQRAESVGRNAPTLQRAFGRFGAHTGALTGAGIGGAAGYHEGGIPGAIAGGLTGVLAPELIASPEGQMAVARSLNMARGLKPAVGAAAQLKKAMTQ
jgi:hypothetical protein